MPSWRRVTLSGAVPVADDLIAFLHERGCLGAEIREGLVLAYFSEEVDASAVLAELAPRIVPGAPALRVESSESVTDGRWHERWMERLAPIRVGRRFCIVPGMQASGPLDGRHALRVTPGQAFGTGEHPTTRMSLELLEEEIQSGWSLLDVGTGSGILAIGGLMLGAAPVLGIDIDEVAIQVARENAAANGLSGMLLAAAGPEALLPHRFDMVAANLDAATLVRLMKALARLVGRRAILSGILHGQRRQVEAAAAAAGLARLTVRREGDWVTMLLGRDGA